MLVARHRAALGLREKAILTEEGKLGLGYASVSKRICCAGTRT